MLLERIYEDDLSQGAWLIGCQATREAIIIDPQRDISRYVDVLKKARLNLIAVAETHIHADFLSGTTELLQTTDAIGYLSGHGGEDWSYKWPELTNTKVTFVNNGDTFQVGNIKIKVVHTPGHTPEHICFLIHDKNTEAYCCRGHGNRAERCLILPNRNKMFITSMAVLVFTPSNWQYLVPV